MKFRFIVKRRPKEYRATKQQIHFKKALEYCGIRKGMSKEELQKSMKECIPEYWKKVRRGEID